VASGVLLAFAAVVLLLNVPSLANASSPAASSNSRPAVATGYAVTWNGVNVTTASSTSSALSIDFTQSATVLFNWSLTTAVTMGSAQLQMFYFGFAVTTRTQTVNNPVSGTVGGIPLTWTPLSLAYVLEGLYKITASFIASNGTTMFSESFYVRANALYGFVAAIPIVLLILVIYEVYALVRSGRYAMLGRKETGSPPATPPPQTPEGTAPSEAAAPSGAPSTPGAEPPDSTPPADSSAPPSGGSS
jgi:hypothetical protein